MYDHVYAFGENVKKSKILDILIFSKYAGGLSVRGQRMKFRAVDQGL